ncbi:MAG: TetR/AcrR family transcriptional regulator [Anaerolineaceae bacterium]|nr:TetR/AcrR family transcriptional regulator [Anaerolineaceae bacterium]
MDNTFTSILPTIIANFEQQGLVTRTFRRLDLSRQLLVIDAILEESAQRGPAEMNIKHIAARAEVSIGSLYQYFNNKEGLLNFTIALTVQQTVSAFNEFLPYLDQLSFKEAYSIYLSTGLEWGQQEQQFVRMFAKAAYQNDPQLQERVVKPIAASMLNIMRMMVKNGQEKAEIRQELDPDLLARLLHGISIILADPILLPYLNDYFQIIDEDREHNEPLNLVMEILQRGIFVHHDKDEQTS